MTGKKPFVLFAASECAPLCKTGGLADVVGALPKALSKHSVSSAVILPYYSILPESIKNKSALIASFIVQMGWKNQYAGLLTATHYGRRYYFIDNEEYFKRDALYGYYEDTERYMFFSMAVVEAVKHLYEHVDIIHCNDWQSSLIPFVLNKYYREQKGYEYIKTVLTIHNLRFQGNINISDFIMMINSDGKESWLGEAVHENQANMLKAGILNADYITTVSPNYADEIKSEFYGESLEPYILSVDHKLKGILNGIDTSSFDPAKDSKIYNKYSDIKGKVKNKESFTEEYHLKNSKDMMIGMVTRLDRQKGLDLITYALHDIMNLDINFVLLGTGDPQYESVFYDLEKTYRDKVRCFIMYDDVLARKIYAASDLFLMPSLFEPCGLGQLIAMRYGTLPLVRETGGLKDTVIPYNRVTGEGTGFSFANYNGDELSDTIKRAYEVYNNNPYAYKAMAARAMAQNFSWSKSAKEYKELYLSLIEE